MPFCRFFEEEGGTYFERTYFEPNHFRNPYERLNTSPVNAYLLSVVAHATNTAHVLGIALIVAAHEAEAETDAPCDVAAVLAGRRRPKP